MITIKDKVKTIISFLLVLLDIILYLQILQFIFDQNNKSQRYNSALTAPAILQSQLEIPLT